eukprot:TRINITY_DN7496_c0_g1_i1.p1 TRINITY_DN7496_c0_g1~~TRINITY_DN7496_c0_g1_i1.p1  ORF type:complete len:172 (-),score=23.34 TRINITY_DN7496_c0_g1_i1:899-1414(-)
MPLSSMVDLEAGLQPSPKPRAESHTLLALEWALRWAMRVLSPCLVVFTTALVFTFVQIFFSDLVYLIATPYTVSYCAHSAAVLWIAANGMFNMLMCALTSPGYAPTRDELHRRILDGVTHTLFATQPELFWRGVDRSGAGVDSIEATTLTVLCHQPEASSEDGPLLPLGGE